MAEPKAKEPEAKEKEKAIIVDLEGTLSDSSWRQHFLDNKEYHNWNIGLKVDSPNLVIIALVKQLSHDHKIIIATAKPIEYEQMAKEWFNLNCNFEYALWLSRPQGSHPPPSSFVVKKTFLDKIRKRYDVVLAIDDRFDICRMYRNNGIAVINAQSLLSDLITEPEKSQFTPLTETISKIKVTPRPVSPYQAYQNPEQPAPCDESPESILKKAAKTFGEKQKEYGAGYLRHGDIMSCFFPDGLHLKTADDFLKFHLFELDVIKSNRLASSKFTHKDSWHDKIIYAAMGEGVSDR